MTLEELQSRLQTLKRDAEVATEAGLDRGTILKLRKGKHNPRLNTFHRVCDAVKKVERKARAACQASV